MATLGAGAHVQPRGMAGYTLPTYPFRTPKELADGRIGRHPVVVVGGGLVGLTLALDLGLRGVPVVVLDEDDSVGAAGISSRGVVYVQRTLEIFQRLGVAGPVMAKGVGWHVGRVYQGDAEVYAFNAQAAGATQHPAHTNLQQFFVEQYLVERIANVPSIDLRWRNKLVRIEQDEGGVDLDVETPEGAYRLRADWVGACDGGGSFVRRSLGVPTDTQRFEDQWCIADLRPEGGRPVERRMYLDAPFNQGGVVLNHQLADGVCRINCQISHYDDPEEAGTLPAIHRRVQQALGPGAAYELVWTGVWRFKRRITERFVDGRVMFVGDSAHELPPFGARGGNSGVADADNLGWKLAMVIRGEAAPALLQSYHAERYPAAVENIAVACRSARFLHPGTPGERLFRDAILALAHLHPRHRPMVNTGRLCGASHYSGSALNGTTTGTARGSRRGRRS